ncbi:MAG: TRAP transporter permease [Syntrophobacterales bacterium]|nr:TRAP transporter permease [Syntrophobacterales bacterium]
MARNNQKTLEEIISEESGHGRSLAGWSYWLVSIIGILWCLFQLSIASWLILDTTYTRAIHLACAISMVFLSYPMLKKSQGRLGFLGSKTSVPWIDWMFAVLAAFSALYIVLDYEGITRRYGAPLTRDVVVGLMLIIFLLEASRRVVGPTLSLIAGLFIAYAFLGPYMPEAISFRGVSVNRFIGQMTMSTEGIYGIPLHVSATMVFFFVLFGAMLEKAGAGKFFIQLALSLLGSFRGGPAKAAIISSLLTGMVSGSSVANVVTTGTFTIPLMKRVGYKPEKAAAIEVAASVDGQIAPPVMGAAAFIIAEYVNVPYIDVIKAAAIPAFASYAALFYIVHLEAVKLNLKGLPKQELPSFTKTLKEGFHFLIPIFALVYELVVVRHSPELAAFHAIIIIGLIILLQKPLRALKMGNPLLPSLKEGIKDLFSSLSTGARNMMNVAMATATAGIIVGVVSLGLGGLVNQIVETLSGGNIYLLLIITAIASLIIGMGLPTTATYIVMASLTAPAIVEVGENYGFTVPIMAAHLFCFFFGILADDTPPVGLASFAASAIARSDPIRTGIQAFTYDIRTAVLPFMFIFNHELILHNVNDWFQGILIFIMACIGNFAFASATQGIVLVKNRFYEIPLLLGTTLCMMRPEAIATVIGIPYELRYTSYLIGLALFGLVIGLQKLRKGR